MVLPLTWVSSELSEKIDLVGFRSKSLKLDLIGNYNPSSDLEGFVTDINEPTIPEYLSFLVAKKMRRSDLEQLSPVLQAMISYRISAYDYIEDEHLYKCEKETVLKTRGNDYLLRMMKVYSEISIEIGSKLQNLGIIGAKDIAEEQYSEIIEADKKRNLGIIPSVKETIEVQESLSGKPARKLAYLSGGGQIEKEFLFHLVNSICTLEDLMHLLIKEDLEKPKATIPLAVINEYIPLEKIKDNSSYKLILKKSVGFTLDYISGQISRLERLTMGGGFEELNEFSSSINNFIKRHILPEI
jgi:hypothetical protein